MSLNLPVNININPACNGWIIFVTPKFVENVGDRAFVASSIKELETVTGFLSQNINPRTKEPMAWPIPEEELNGQG